MQDVSSTEGTLRQQCSNFRGMVRVRPRPIILVTMSCNLLVESVYPSLVTSHLGVVLTKLIGYVRVSTRQQSIHRQQAGFLAVSVRREDLWSEIENGKTVCQGRMAGVGA